MKRFVSGVVACGTAAILLSACSGAPQGGSAGLLPSAAGPNLRAAARANAHALQLPGGRVLYVTDNGKSEAAALDVIQYRSWVNVGSIPFGNVTPLGVWVDKNGNFYVAEASNTSSSSNVYEYDSAGDLIFTYSSALGLASAVTTDRRGNVYVADNGWTGDFSPHVAEFEQGVNESLSCPPVGTGSAHGIAVDRQGDVFLTVDYSSGGASIVEYPRGIIKSRCVGTVLPIEPGPYGSFYGAAVDTQGNLLVASLSPYSASVDTIAPPYTSVTGSLGSGWSAPFDVTIDRAGTRAYVTDAGTKTVTILAYPSGAIIATLDSANGISAPLAAVDSKNYVP